MSRSSTWWRSPAQGLVHVPGQWGQAPVRAAPPRPRHMPAGRRCPPVNSPLVWGATSCWQRDRGDSTSPPVRSSSRWAGGGPFGKFWKDKTVMHRQAAHYVTSVWRALRDGYQNNGKQEQTGRGTDTHTHSRGSERAHQTVSLLTWLAAESDHSADSRKRDSAEHAAWQRHSWGPLCETKHTVRAAWTDEGAKINPVASPVTNVPQRYPRHWGGLPLTSESRLAQ